jgi:hypothetical protein
MPRRLFCFAAQYAAVIGYLLIVIERSEDQEPTEPTEGPTDLPGTRML